MGGGAVLDILANPSFHEEEPLEKLIVTQLLNGYLPAFTESDGSHWPGFSLRREPRPIFMSHFFVSENESSSSSYSYSRTLVTCWTIRCLEGFLSFGPLAFAYVPPDETDSKL